MSVRAQRPFGIVTILGLVLCALCLLLVRNLVHSRALLEQGRQWQKEGDYASAIFAYQQAASAYFPGNPYGDTAFELLRQMAARATQDKDDRGTRLALEGLVVASQSSFSFFTPRVVQRDASRERLAALMAEDIEIDGGPGRQRRIRRRAAARYLMVMMTRDVSAWPAVLVGLGLALWLGAASLFLFRGVMANLRLSRGPTILSAGAFVLGFVLFVAGLAV